MESTVQISITFLMNRFHGEEWPCSPARLFRALVAGSMTGGNRQYERLVEPALRWLERQAPPEIYALPAPLGESYRISVPNNDMDVAAWEWASNRAYDASQLRTMKTVRPRWFIGNGPHLAFRWPGVLLDSATEEGLRMAVHAMHTLGWGIDMAFADISLAGQETSGAVRWTAQDGGRLLPLPVEGSLDDLKATYARFLNSVTRSGVNPDTRPSVYRMQGYSNGHVAPRQAVFELAPTSSKSFAAEQAIVIAAWLRHAVAEALRQENISDQIINEVALGHNEQGVNADRLAYIPLPSVGFKHVDGRIRRVMLAMRGDDELLKLIRKKLNGWEATDLAGVAVCRLTSALDRKVIPFYLDEKREWASVTPVILHGHNAANGNISIRKTDKLLGQAFEQAGHDLKNIEEWTIQSAPFWPNTPGARSYRVPKHLERWPRYHVSVKFRDNIKGPVLAGIGRHYGLGVFAGWK